MLILAALFLLGVASIGYTAATPRVVVEEHYQQMSRPTIRLQKGMFRELRDRETGLVYPHVNYSVTGFRTSRQETTHRLASTNTRF